MPGNNPESHVLKFKVPDLLHGDIDIEIQITIGFYGTSATLIINDKTVAQVLDDKWRKFP